MLKLVEAIIGAVASFAATNVDDIIILMLFFAQVHLKIVTYVETLHVTSLRLVYLLVSARYVLKA